MVISGVEDWSNAKEITAAECKVAEIQWPEYSLEYSSPTGPGGRFCLKKQGSINCGLFLLTLMNYKLKEFQFGGSVLVKSFWIDNRSFVTKMNTNCHRRGGFKNQTWTFAMPSIFFCFAYMNMGVLEKN